MTAGRSGAILHQSKTNPEDKANETDRGREVIAAHPASAQSFLLQCVPATLARGAIIAAISAGLGGLAG
jgi:hypothetical protein